MTAPGGWARELGGWPWTRGRCAYRCSRSLPHYRSGNNGDIYFSLRDPVTGSWSANERVSDDATGRTQWNAAIAVDGAGVAYAVWQDQRDGKKTPDTNIYASKRSGGAWGANLRVNDDTGAAAPQSSARI